MPLSLKKECTRGNSGCRTALNGEVLTDNADDNTVPMLSGNTETVRRDYTGRT